MEGGRLPDAGRLRAMLAGVSIASTLLTLGLLVVYLPHVIDLTDAHVAFLGRAALPICLGILILPLVVHQRRARPLFFALKRHADAAATPQDWRPAFACAVDLPRFAFVSTLLYYPLGGAGVAVALYSHDPAVGLTAPSMIAASALVAGFLAQSVAFVTLKFVLEPTRHRLASAIPDATERGNLVRPISLATKLFVSVAGLTLVTAFFTLSLSAGRAADAIEEFIVDIQRPLLLRIGRSIDAGEDPYRLIPRVRETFAPLGLELVVLEPGALASEVDPSGRLDDFELRFVRQTMERTGGDGTQHSLALFSPRVFSWIRSTGGRTIVAVSEIDVAAVTAESGFLTGMLSLFSIGVALALAGALSRDLQRAARTVRTNVNRIAAGDLTPGETLESEDELGELARVVDGTRNALRRTIGDVASASDAVEHAAEDIKRASDRVARSTADQTSRIADVSQSTERVNVQMGGIAESAAALNSTVDESSSSIRELQALGRSLEENAAAASARADESSASSKQMAESVREVLENTTRLFERVSEGSRNAEELATTARDVRAHADQTGQLSSSVLATAERGRERVDRTIGGIEQIRDATETARQVIEGLGERTERIGGVLSVIDDLASDTNLLSLNAAIIAAQAGEHGRAFAVVADEVRALADRVLESTKEIEALIHGLQTEAQSAIAAIHRGAESVREGVDLSAGAGDSLAEITATAQASGERVEEIVAAVRSQSDAAAQVKEQMEQILIGIREIQAAGHEHSRGGEIVLANAQGVGEVAKRVQQSTEEQVENVSRIAETVQVVRRAAVAINDSLQEQSASMREVAAALEDMSARTRSNDESVRRFGDTASSLVAQAERVRRAIGRFQLD